MEFPLEAQRAIVDGACILCKLMTMVIWAKLRRLGHEICVRKCYGFYVCYYPDLI